MINTHLPKECYDDLRKYCQGYMTEKDEQEN